MRVTCFVQKSKFSRTRAIHMNTKSQFLGNLTLLFHLIKTHFIKFDNLHENELRFAKVQVSNENDLLLRVYQIKEASGMK